MSTAAVERTLALLEPEARVRAEAAALAGPGAAGPGYVDLLDAEETPPSTGLVQDFMLSRAVPVIYEGLWRPTLGRIAKGPLGPSMSDEHRIAAELMGLRRGHRVLDVACGPGNFTRAFARTVGPDGLAVGIDASETMLARAVADTPARDVAYVRGDALNLPFADGSFDGVCCFAALNLFSAPWRALDAMARVLAPGGRLALFTSCRRGPRALAPLTALAGPVAGIRMFGADELVGALRERGFSEVTRRVAGLTQIVGGRSRG